MFINLKVGPDLNALTIVITLNEKCSKKYQKMHFQRNYALRNDQNCFDRHAVMQLRILRNAQ